MINHIEETHREVGETRASVTTGITGSSQVQCRVDQSPYSRTTIVHNTLVWGTLSTVFGVDRPEEQNVQPPFSGQCDYIALYTCRGQWGTMYCHLHFADVNLQNMYSP